MAPKTVSALQTDSKTSTFLEKLAGAFCVGSFVVIWISSCASPIILLAFIVKEYYASAAVVVVITAIAYAPWKRGSVSSRVKWFYGYYNPRFYKSVSLEFEGSSLPSPSDPQTFYAVHPHGAFCIGWSILFCDTVMEHVRFCFAPSLYASPFFRLFSRLCGKPGSAAKFAMVKYMKAGEHLALPPGGFEEATLSSTTQDRVYVKRRTGFIRLCLMHGLAVRPVYVFGEKALFWNVQGMWKFRLTLNRYGAPAVLVWGQPLFPCVAKNNVNISVVVGAPLVLPKIDQPTKEEVTLWHGKYVAALTKLFEEHKESAYGPEKGKVAKLEVW